MSKYSQSLNLGERYTDGHCRRFFVYGFWIEGVRFNLHWYRVKFKNLKFTSCSFINFDKHMYLCNYHHDQDLEYFYCLQNSPLTLCSHPLILLPTLDNTDLSSIPVVLSFPEYDINAF